MSYFDTIKRSYTDVDTSNGINTEQFLEATEAVVKLFDLLGSAAFSIVQNDMNGNIKKIHNKFESDQAANVTLQSLMENESPQKKRVATEGLLWLSGKVHGLKEVVNFGLSRQVLSGLNFTAQALRQSILNPDEEISASFTKAYAGTLKTHHNFVVRGLFSTAMKACPYRKDFYAKIGVVTDATLETMKEWLQALEAIIATINAVFEAHPEYIKGM